MTVKSRTFTSPREEASVRSGSSSPTRWSAAPSSSGTGNPGGSVYTSCDTADLHGHARVHLGSPDEAVDLEVLPQLDVHQPRGGAVVERRHAVPAECGGIAEPARHVAPRLRAEDLFVGRVDG